MPKQRRPSSSPSSTPGSAGSPPPAGGDVDPDVARFAAALQESARREAEAKRRAAEQRAAADAKAAEERAVAEAEAAEAARVRNLGREKDQAAARLRDARRSGRGVAEAEAAYKLALAAVVAAETGERPAWAPPEPTPSDEGPDPDAEPVLGEGDGEDGAERTAGDEGDGGEPDDLATAPAGEDAGGGGEPSA